MNRDPIGEDGGLNLYVFVINRPHGLVDVNGLAANVFAPTRSGLGYAYVASLVNQQWQAVDARRQMVPAEIAKLKKKCKRVRYIWQYLTDVNDEGQDFR